MLCVPCISALCGPGTYVLWMPGINALCGSGRKCVV